MFDVLNLKNRQEFLNNKNYLANLRKINQIVRTNGVVHNVKFLGVYNNNKKIFLYTCFDSDNKMVGILALETANLVVGPASNLQPAPSVTTINNALYLLYGVIGNIAEQQKYNGR